MGTRVPKCVKAPSEKLDSGTFAQAESLVGSYCDCMDAFYARFSGIRSMCLVQKREDLRDAIKAEQKALKATMDVRTDGRKLLVNQFHFQERHWIMALFDVCVNINSAWTNLAEDVKDHLRENGNLLDRETPYCCYILGARPLWQAVLLEKPFAEKQTKAFKKLREAVDPGRVPYLHGLLRRLTRKLKASIPKTRQRQSMMLDQEMYSIREKGGAYYLEFASRERGKRFRVKLACPYTWKKSGDIRIVLDRGKHTVTVHKLIHVKGRRLSGEGQELGVDKGYSTLLSCSDDREYGAGAGLLMTAEAERVNKRNTGRNQTIQKKKAFDQKAAEVRADASLTQAERDRAAAALQNQSRRLEIHNTGTGKYGREHNRALEAVTSLVNHSIYRMVEESMPPVIVKEHLSSIERKDAKKGKAFNRKMSSWASGFLDERLGYIAGLYHILTADVNPAYTSQFCPVCGAHVTRTGVHHEVSACPNCGEGNANTGAAKNILARYHDPEVTLYTPYKKVRGILERRYSESRPGPAPA